MRNFVKYYLLLLGVSIIGQWVMLLSTGNVPELITEPISICFHITAEVLMGLLLLISSIMLNKKYGDKISLLALGLVIYSVINSAGYFVNKNEWPMVVMFAIILILSVVNIFYLIKRRGVR